MDILFWLAALAALLCFPDVCTASAREALRIWGLDVVPSLFPYMVFSRLLSASLRRRGIPASLLVPALGLAGGSPSGAAALASCAREGRLPVRSLASLAALTGTISPMFFLGTVRTWTGDARLARRLLVSHLLGAVFAAICVRCLPVRASTASGIRSPSVPQPHAQEENPILECIDAVLRVGGCILLFSVAAACSSLLLPASMPVLRAVLHALLEAAGGAHALIVAPLTPRARSILLAALTSLGGFSILTQNELFLRPFGLRLPQLAMYGLLRALAASVLMALMLR